MLHPKIDDDSHLSGEYLSEKFSLLVTPSLMKFKENQRLVLCFYLLQNFEIELTFLWIYTLQSIKLTAGTFYAWNNILL